MARRYARALLDVTGANADAALAELETLVGALQESAELWTALANPVLGRDRRLAAMEQVLASVGTSKLVGNLVKLVMERNRVTALPAIVRSFRTMVDEAAGRVRGSITSARPLDAPAVDSVRKSLERLTGKKVELQARVDASLLGGAVAQVGSTTWDGSLKNQLRELERQLLGPSR